MDHENYSELLVPYVRRELHADTVAEVEDHLAECADCRLEEAGVRALYAVEVEPMTDLERAGLRRELRAQVSLPETSRERMAWLPPALSAAAVLLAIVVGIQFFGGGGDGGGDAAGGGGTELADEGPRPQTVRLISTGALLRASSGESAAAPGSQPAPDEESDESFDPTGDQNGNVAEERLSRDLAFDGAALYTAGGRERAARRLTGYVRRGETFSAFANAYSVADIDDLQEAFLDQLAADAPEEATVQLVECADRMLAAQTYPMLPVVAGHGRFAGEPALMLGFVWSQKDEGPLNRYWLFVWPRGNCEIQLHSQAGKVPT